MGKARISGLHRAAKKCAPLLFEHHRHTAHSHSSCFPGGSAASTLIFTAISAHIPLVTAPLTVVFAVCGVFRCSSATNIILLSMAQNVDDSRRMAKKVMLFDFATPRDDPHIVRKGAARRSGLCVVCVRGRPSRECRRRERREACACDLARSLPQSTLVDCPAHAPGVYHSLPGRFGRSIYQAVYRLPQSTSRW